MIRIVPPEDYEPLDQACARAAEFDWIVFSSANAVDAFVDRLLEGPQDVRCLNGVKLCVVGPATAERLSRHGLKVDLTPPEYRADAVLRALSETATVKGLKILLPRADIAPPGLEDVLEGKGWSPVRVVAYRTGMSATSRSSPGKKSRPGGSCRGAFAAVTAAASSGEHSSSRPVRTARS